MTECGYYPTGAQYDSSAPYNIEPMPEGKFGVLISSCLSKSLDVYTNDYQIELDYDDEGHAEVCPDTSQTDWRKAYETKHLTPIELIDKFREILEQLIEMDSMTDKKTLKLLAKECEGWTEDEYEVMEE